MSYTTHTTNLDDLKKYIKNGWIKTPKNIARKFKVSKRTALRLISQLKENGVKINYSAKEKRYKIFE
jgi:predicted DNA-binding transcriptional regulator YafY